MKKTIYRPKSEGEAQSRMVGKALTVFAIAMIVISLFYIIPFNVSSIVGYPHAYFTRAPFMWKLVGFVVLALWFFFYFRNRVDMMDDAVPTTWMWFVMFAGLALVILCFAGWDFSLRGIEV